MLKTALTFDDVNIIPGFSDINSREECSTETTFCGISLSCPIVPANMLTITGANMCAKMHDLGSIGILHRFNGYREEVVKLIKDFSPPIRKYAMSIGTKRFDEEFEFIKSLPIKPCFVVIDVAHGHHRNVGNAVLKIKNEAPTIKIVAGNVATGEGALYLAGLGADAIKVGIGNGGLCETRIRTGVGIPQITAIAEVYCALQENGFDNVDIIADGGIKTPGDVAKAIGIGATVVMTGGLFAGTKETPLPIKRSGTWPNEQLYKEYFGSASRKNKEANGEAEKHVEGNSTLIPYRGKAERIFKDIQDGLRSSMSYVGARTLQEFQSKVEFVQVTANGTLEAHPFWLSKK